MYSHVYNTGYIGKTNNLRRRFNEECSRDRSNVKRFCDSINVNTRETLDIYEIIQRNKADAAYYEGDIYDLIVACFSRINLINKYKPNRSRDDWLIVNSDRVKSLCQAWRVANKDHIKGYSKQWYSENRESCKIRNRRWCEVQPEYFKKYYKKRKPRNR